MGYATEVDVDGYLGQALTSARPDSSSQKIKLININNERDLNRIPTDIVELYISSADQVIDGILTEMYRTPLKKCADGQWNLQLPLSEYNQIVEVDDSTNLVVGDEVVIRDDNRSIEEFHVVATIRDQFSFTTVDSIGTFDTAGVRVIRLRFPPPITQVSARIAAANIYDKYFAAQNSPNISEYGKELRKEAIGRLNDVLNGKIILKCQSRIGNRFASATLFDTYAHQDRGYKTSDREMSRPQ